MSYVLFGRAIKSEYLALGTLFGTGSIVWAATGGKKKQPAAEGKSPVEQAKDAVPLNAGSSEEEELMNSIKTYVAEAEKEVQH